MAIVFKPVNPKKFNSKVFNEEFEKAVEEVANDMLFDFEATTATWNHEVKFEKLTSIGPTSVDAMVGTDDEIYGYVDKGTRPHEIRAKNKKSLAFPGGPYKAKTKKGVLGSVSGGPSGEYVYPVAVQHPGTEAREFDITIEKKYTPIFKKRMEKALRDGRIKCGHAA